jgi:signal transduction histidine kinase
MRSLFARLFQAQLVVILITILVLGFSLSYMYTQYIFSLKEQELIRIGQRLASEFGTAALPLRITRVRALLEAAHVYGDASIWVINADGVVLVGSPRARSTERVELDETEVQALFSGQIVRQRSMSKESTAEPSFVVAVPIISRLGVAGAIVLSAPLLGVMHTIRDGHRLIFWAGVLAAALAAMVSFFFSRRVAEPLQEMRSVALDMARGDFRRRVRVRGRRDEIDELSMAFNDLATRLDSTIRALAEEKSKTDSCIAGLSEGVLAIDTNQEIILINAAAVNLLHPVTIGLGDSLPDLFDDCQDGLLQHLKRGFDTVLRDKEPHTFSLDSTTRAVMVNINPVQSPDDTLLGAAALLQDVSERYRLEKMRRDFVADVSHELRTPLTSIYGFAQAIVDGVANTQEQVQRYLGIIMDESLRLIRLTNNLIDLSRIETHHVRLNLIPLSLADAVSDAIASLEPQFAEKDITVHPVLAPALPFVYADADRLEQILLNLLDNAARHAPKGGRIVLRAGPADDGYVELSIEDSGPGIPEEELPYIWERFYKVDKARRQNRTGGTGLGLVIVKQLVELHGGRVRAENMAEGGAKFTVTLPVDSKAASSNRHEAVSD